MKFDRDHIDKEKTENGTDKVHDQIERSIRAEKCEKGGKRNEDYIEPEVIGVSYRLKIAFHQASPPDFNKTGINSQKHYKVNDFD